PPRPTSGSRALSKLLSTRFAFMFRRVLLQDLYRVRGHMFGRLQQVGFASHIPHGNCVEFCAKALSGAGSVDTATTLLRRISRAKNLIIEFKLKRHFGYKGSTRFIVQALILMHHRMPAHTQGSPRPPDADGCGPLPWGHSGR